MGKIKSSRSCLSCLNINALISNKGRSRFAGLSGVENMHSEQRRNRALVWHDLFGDKPYRSGIGHKAQGARKRSTFTK